MRINTVTGREAYRRGARDMFEHTFHRVPAPQLRELEQWLKELDSWEVGDPPPPPKAWVEPGIAFPR